MEHNTKNTFVVDDVDDVDNVVDDAFDNGVDVKVMVFLLFQTWNRSWR